MGDEIGREAVIYVEFGTSGGVQQPISISTSPSNWAAKSRLAFDSAMSVVSTVVEKFNTEIDSLVKKPTSVELKFGLTFDVEVGAIFAKMSQEGSLSIKLSWDTSDMPLKGKT